ncbi:O-antigen ligase family protein [Haloferula sp.]|uniref:O-antigen ligase family protein n=1 Tax=Haloferula sp. TaxID=2497595 RepID=UPI003C73D08E
MILSDTEDPVHVPQSPQVIWVERLLWVFIMSFALDYRASDARADSGGAGLDQLLFLSLAAFSTLGILYLGWRHLLVRPGAWFIAGWGAFLAFMVSNALLQGVDIGRSLRIVLPLGLCFAGIVNAHIAACMGLRPSRIVAPILVAACTNVVWRIVQGFLFKGVTMETARVEVQSSANNWIAAFIGCGLLLRSRFHWTILLATGVLFTGIMITITRSLLLPIMASALASTFCFMLGTRWRAFRLGDAPRRLSPVILVTVFAVLAIGAVAIVQPLLIERWNERLFHHSADRNTTADISWLTREAEAVAIFEILNKDPIHYLYGHGIGASYYWDPDYMPEIYLVYPEDMVLGEDVWFAGHSVWTYALFSGGVVAFVAYVALFIGNMVLSLLAARDNASHPGPDYWLAFLPFISVCCVLSQSITTNPFDERLASIFIGLMVGLPQAFNIRASWIHSSHQPGHV